MNLFGIPGWLFLLVAVVSLMIGIGLRKYLDARKIRQEQAHREEVKALKRQLKRNKKQAKRTAKEK